MRTWRSIAMLLWPRLPGRRGPGAEHDLQPAAQGNADRREPRGDDQERRLVQHLGDQRRRPVDRPAPAGAWTRSGTSTRRSGLDGVWDNSLAADKPIYNADFTEMTVKLRKGIFWSDGVEFTADDVVYTVETQMKTNGLRWSAPFQINVAERRGARPLHRRLQAEEAELALPRPVHGALERDVDHAQARLREGRRSAEVRLQPAGRRSGAYMLHSYDPERQVVHLAEARRLAAHDARAASASPGPKYVAYVDPGPPDKRVIAQLNHELDIIHDISPEGMFTLAKQSKSSHGWFKGFPYAHPDPTLPAVIFNHQNETVQEPRRALGAGAADRHQGGVDGVLSRRGDDLGDRRAADRHASRRLPRAAARTG